MRCGVAPCLPGQPLGDMVRADRSSPDLAAELVVDFRAERRTLAG